MYIKWESVEIYMGCTDPNSHLFEKLCISQKKKIIDTRDLSWHQLGWHDNNLYCNQWQQSWLYDNSQFSVLCLYFSVCECLICSTCTWCTGLLGGLEVRALGPWKANGALVKFCLRFQWNSQNWRIGNVFQWRDPSKFAWGPWKFKWLGPRSGPGPSTKNVYQEPWCNMYFIMD